MHESVEDYLEAILILGKSGRTVRAVDIASELEFSKPSVSIAVKKLRERGLIAVTADGYINLTADGQEIAARVYERHTLISDWLISLGVDEKTALTDACRMEHTMSEQSFEAIKKFILGTVKQ